MRSALPVSTYTDATVIPFGDHMLRAVEIQAALELGSKLPDDEKARLMLSPTVFGLWGQEVLQAVTAEKLRQARILRRPYGVGAVVS